MILFAALLAGLIVACFVFKFSAEFGTGRDLRHLQSLRQATPSHTYTDHNGTEGRWP